tara:strand:- start:10218 stop:10547 length:330 start_codon:yes stop_codon:yes gene_type:complete
MTVYKSKNQELEARIMALENKQKVQFSVLKTELNHAYLQLKPSKLLSRAIEDIKETPKAKKNLFEVLISVAGGYFSKRLIVGKSNSMFKSLFGYTIQYLSTKVISKSIE